MYEKLYERNDKQTMKLKSKLSGDTTQTSGAIIYDAISETNNEGTLIQEMYMPLMNKIIYINNFQNIENTHIKFACVCLKVRMICASKTNLIFNPCSMYSWLRSFQNAYSFFNHIRF